MTDDEFVLEIIKRTKDSRLSPCGARKTSIPARARVDMLGEEVQCRERLIELEREAMIVHEERKGVTDHARCGD